MARRAERTVDGRRRLLAIVLSFQNGTITDGIEAIGCVRLGIERMVCSKDSTSSISSSPDMTLIRAPRRF